MPDLKISPTLLDYQKYVIALEQERGFSEQTILEKCLMLNEEVGELCKAIRKQQKIKIDVNSKTGSIGEELADCMIMLLSIANHSDIDLEREFRKKEDINKQRVWT